MRRRAWAWLLVVPAALFVLVSVTAPFATFHQHLYLSGTPQRFAATVVRAGRSNARAALWLDNVFVLSWLLVVPRCLTAGLVRWAPERRRLVPLWRAAPRVALLAGCVDLIENALALSQVGKTRPPTGVLLAITCLTWAKWMLYGVALAGLLALVVGPLVASVIRPTMRRLFAPLDGHGPAADAGAATGPALAAESVATAGPSPRIGLAVATDRVSLGSAFALGVLRRLDEPRPDGASVVRRAERLVAGAGAAPVVGGWLVADRTRDGASDDVSFSAGPWAEHVRTSLVRLSGGPLAPFGGVRAVVGRCLVAVVTVVAAAYTLGVVLGSTIRTRAIHAWFPYTDGTAETIMGLRELVPLRLVLPGVALLAVGGLLHLAARRHARLASYAWAAIVGGVLLIALLLVAPIIVRYGRRLLVALPFVHRADSGALVLACIALTVLGVGVWLLVAPRPSFVAGRLLVGAAGGTLAVLVAGKAADTFARGTVGGMAGAWVSWPLPAGEARMPVIVLAVLWLAAVAVVPPHRLWLFESTRRTMADAFLPGGDLEWAAVGPTRVGPQVSIVGAVGPSSSIVVGEPGVTVHAGLGDTGARVPAASLPTGSWWDGFPTGWTVGRSMSLIGLSTGEWMPNPRTVQWFADPTTSPRVHPGLVVGRVLGRHRPGRDAFVHAGGSDGSGVLALLEVLRSRPDVVLSTGSGDARTFVAGIAPVLAEVGITLAARPDDGAAEPDRLAGWDGAARRRGPASRRLSDALAADERNGIGEPGGAPGRPATESRPATVSRPTTVVTATIGYPDGTTALLVHGGAIVPNRAVTLRGADRVTELIEAGHALADRMVGLFDRRTP